MLPRKAFAFVNAVFKPRLFHTVHRQVKLNQAYFIHSSAFQVRLIKCC